MFKEVKFVWLPEGEELPEYQKEDIGDSDSDNEQPSN